MRKEKSHTWQSTGRNASKVHTDFDVLIRKLQDGSFNVLVTLVKSSSAKINFVST